MDLETAFTPVIAHGVQKLCLTTPKMRAARDFTEERLGKSTIFQTNQRRELLTVESQLAKGVTVGDEISRKEDGNGSEASLASARVLVTRPFEAEPFRI